MVDAEEIDFARGVLMAHAVPRLGREDAEDLVQYALADASRRYDPNRRARFSTFAFRVYKGDYINFMEKVYRRRDLLTPKPPRTRDAHGRFAKETMKCERYSRQYRSVSQ